MAPKATAFPIENRQGLHDQSIVKVAGPLNKLVKALPNGTKLAQAASDKGKGRASDLDAVEQAARWLSDWHLLAFLSTVFDQVSIAPSLLYLAPLTGSLQTDMALLSKAATTKDASAIEALLQSPAWQTLTTIAVEHEGRPLHSSFARHSLLREKAAQTTLLLRSELLRPARTAFLSFRKTTT